MLLRMALSTQEIQAVMDSIARVRPSGLLVYTVLHTGDALPRFSIALEPGGPPSAPGFRQHLRTRRLRRAFL
jgi:hypothetical protein